jgi:hypothetical protein
LPPPPIPPPSVWITGPDQLYPNQQGTYIAIPNGGVPPYINYQWYIYYPCGGELKLSKINPTPLLPPCGYWVDGPAGPNLQQLTRSDTKSFSLKCFVTDSRGLTGTSNILEVFVYGSLAKGEMNFNDQIPNEFSLSQNTPNPFNPTTSIYYGLPKSAYVKLKIYNDIGQEIKSLVNNSNSAGYHIAIWDGKNDNGILVPSGIYFYIIQIESDGKITYQKTNKMFLLK